jgi:hypothetical protein
MPLVVVCLCRKPKGAYELCLDVRAGEPYIVQDAHAFKLQRCCAQCRGSRAVHEAVIGQERIPP